MQCEICIEPLETIDAHKTEVTLGLIVTVCAPCDEKLLDAMNTLTRAKQRLLRMLPAHFAELDGAL